MASEHPYYSRLNDSMVPSSSVTVRWGSNMRSSAPAYDVRLRRQSRPYFSLNLSGCKISEYQKDQLLALSWRGRGTRLVLTRISSFCEIGTEIGRNYVGLPVVEPCSLGMGTGDEQDFQLRKRIHAEGYDEEFDYYIVSKPHVNYPVQKDINGNAWAPMPDVQIWEKIGSTWVAMHPLDYEIDRDTGIVTTISDYEVGATGGFYILMVLPSGGIEWSSGKDTRGGWYTIDENVVLEEPAGGR